MMTNVKIHCCGVQAACVNYKYCNALCFKLVRIASGEKITYKSENGICWLIVLRGKLLVKTSGKEAYFVEAGEMVLMSSLLDYIYEGGEETELLTFVSNHLQECSTRLIREIAKSGEEIDYRFNTLPVRHPVDLFLKLLLQYLKDGICCGHLQELKQEELFKLLGIYYTREKLALFLYPFTLKKDEDFRKVVVSHVLLAKNVQELVEMSGYTMTVFKKIFKETFNEPIYQWMLKQKADKLRMRLTENDVNLKEVIDEFGFSSPAHFTKFCKKWLGKVPTQYIEDIKRQRELIDL